MCDSFTVAGIAVVLTVETFRISSVVSAVAAAPALVMVAAVVLEGVPFLTGITGIGICTSLVATAAVVAVAEEMYGESDAVTPFDAIGLIVPLSN